MVTTAVWAMRSAPAASGWLLLDCRGADLWFSDGLRRKRLRARPRGEPESGFDHKKGVPRLGIYDGKPRPLRCGEMHGWP